MDSLGIEAADLVREDHRFTQEVDNVLAIFPETLAGAVLDVKLLGEWNTADDLVGLEDRDPTGRRGSMRTASHAISVRTGLRTKHGEQRSMVAHVGQPLDADPQVTGHIRHSRSPPAIPADRTTDQKVGGSSPSERAEVPGHRPVG